MPDAKRQVLKGLAGAGIILLACAWLALVFAGMGILFTANNHSPTLGGVLLLVALVVLIVTMNQWVRAFPGLLILATLNSVLMLYTGHSLNNASVQVPRWQAAVFTLCMAVSAIVTVRFRTIKLNAIDRVALVVFALCIFYQAVAPRFQAVAGPFALGSVALAWGYDRFRHRRDQDSASLSAPEA